MIIKVTDNKIYLHGTIWPNEETYFSYNFEKIDGKYDDIDVHLHTRGGDVFVGNFISQALAGSKSKINMVVDGVAASMGAMIMLEGDTISIVDNGFVMIHAPSGTTRGNAKAHSDSANLLTEMEGNFIERIVARTGMVKAKAKKLMDGNNWFSAKQAKAAKLVDTIIPAKVKVKIDASAEMNTEEVFGRFAAILISENDTAPTAQANNSNNQNTLKMKKAIIEGLGLTSVTAESSDTAVMEAVNAHIANKVGTVQATLDTQKTAFDALQKTVNEGRDAQIVAALAPFKGKIDQATLDAYKTIGETSGIEALNAVLKNVKPATAAFQTITPGASASADAVTGREAWNWDQWQKEDPRGLEKLAKENKEAYTALYKAKYGTN